MSALRLRGWLLKQGTSQAKYAAECNLFWSLTESGTAIKSCMFAGVQARGAGSAEPFISGWACLRAACGHLGE
jgi:hypothetical protein